MPADSRQKQGPGPGGPFQKGRSGNPAGRRPGSRNRATLAAEVLLDGEAEALTRKAVDLALQGDKMALKLCLERVFPQRRSRPVSFDLPRLDRTADLPDAIGSILQEVARGRLLLDEAAALIAMMDSKCNALGINEQEQRRRAISEEVNALLQGRKQQRA